MVQCNMSERLVRKVNAHNTSHSVSELSVYTWHFILFMLTTTDGARLWTGGKGVNYALQ